MLGVDGGGGDGGRDLGADGGEEGRVEEEVGEHPEGALFVVAAGAEGTCERCHG